MSRFRLPDAGAATSVCRPVCAAARVGMLIGLLTGGLVSVGCGRNADPGPSNIGPASSVATRPASGPGATSRVSALRTRPAPRAALERVAERLRMVREQIAEPTDGRPPVTDERVLEAMRSVPRHVFVPRELAAHAYEDSPLPIGYDQTISQPYIVAIMTELLRLGPESRVLEVGTGSGYQAAVLAHMTPHVYTIEIVRPLAERAQRVLRELGYDEVHCRTGDGYGGWPEAAPFDAIIVTCAAEQVPAPLWEQLRPGGRMVIPTGSPWGVQELVVITKTPDGGRQTESVMPVRFVPLVREPPRR